MASPLHTFSTLSSAEQRFFLAAWLLATPVTAGLKLAGFRRMTQLLQRVPRVGRAAASIDPRRGDLLVRRAFRWSPARLYAKDQNGCLPRSMVQYCVHALRGDDVRLCVGVPPDRGAGFEAHAWVDQRDAPRPDIDHATIFELEPR